MNHSHLYRSNCPECAPASRRDAIHAIPQQAQRQEALNDQLIDMVIAANRLGRYDAADFLTKLVNDRRDT